MTEGTKKICRASLAAAATIILILAVASYLYYRDIKQTFIRQISGKLSSLSGHQVEIGDISISLSGAINIHDTRMQNPEGFQAGDLLRIKRVFLNMKYRELLHGRFHVSDIDIHGPELALTKDGQGRLNISDRLIQLFSGKPGTDYRVDQFRIIRGSIEINNNSILRQENISVVLQDLSSAPGTRTTIKAQTELSGENILNLDGWAYLKDKPRKFNLSVTSEGFQLSGFKDILDKYRIEAADAAMDITVRAEGDDTAGVKFAGSIRLRDAGFGFMKTERYMIDLKMDSFFDLREFSLAVHDLSVHADNTAAVSLKGLVSDIMKNPRYSAEMRVSRLNLARFNFIKGMKISGAATSDNIRIKGNSLKDMPAVSGSVKIVDAAVSSKEIDAKKISAELVFASGKIFSARTKATAEVLQAGQYQMKQPLRIELSADAGGRADNITLTSFARVSPLDLELEKGRAVFAEDIKTEIRGTLKNRVFFGEFSVDSDRIRYAGHRIKQLAGKTALTAGARSVVLKTLRLDTDTFRMSAGLVTIMMPDRKTGYSVRIKGMNAEYPEERAVLKNLDLDMQFGIDTRVITGKGTFSSEGIAFRETASGMLSGSARFLEDSFSVQVPRFDIFGGRLNLSAEGKTFKSPYPVQIRMEAGDIDLGSVSKTLSGFVKIPYAISGELGTAVFQGTLDAPDVLRGRASLQAKGLSVVNPESKRSIVKKAYLKSTLVFKGRDLEFSADAKAGSILPSVSGTAGDFMKKDRRLLAALTLPEVKLTDIRDYFWDIFPDSLLYAGLEGSIASQVSVGYDRKGMNVSGNVHLKNLFLEGENSEYSAGPVNGIIPISYNDQDDQTKPLKLPSFERESYENVKKYYAQQDMHKGYSKITIGAFQYGFRLFEDMHLWIRQEGRILNIGRFSANIFGGALQGSAFVDISEGVHYTAGAVLDGLSMTSVCDEIEPIRGYISGKMNGVATLKGSGAGISKLIGKADFWTYGDKEEKTRISREFLQKIGGPSVRAYLGDRSFDKGIMSLYIQKGFLIFRELEISNRNFFGIQDLSVKVAPFNNRISIDHLTWTILQAAERAKKE